MDKSVIGIMCDCATNSDLNGSWTKKDLEEECKDLGIPPEDWMSHLFGHLFEDYSCWNTSLEEAFINNDSLVSMRVMIGFYVVDVTKVYK